MLPIYLANRIENQATNGASGLEDGRCWFVAPFAGKIRRVFISCVTDPGAAQDYTLFTDQGRSGVFGSIPTTLGNGTPIEFEIDQHDEVNFMKTGQAFAIESDGAGSTASIGGVIVEFSPA